MEKGRVMNKIARLCLFTWIFGIADHTCIAADDTRPNEHFCPITIEVMRDPVVAADGHSYERATILHHFDVNGAKSPITGLALRNRDLFDNHALKVMISEWRPGRQSEPSVLETREAGSIAQRVREEFRRNADLLNAAKDQHIVAFLGNTGAGKSTLVNLLAGKELKVSPDGEEYVLVHPDDETAMIIGSGGNSETLYPKCIDVDGLRFFDLPGFNDTDGSERNLVNAAFTRQILLDAASVRLVFVVGQDQFTADRSASVRQMFNAIKQLFVADQSMSLVDDGVFVATKITCTEQTEMTDFLLRRTDSKDKAELNAQLKAWNQRGKLCRMFHPLRGDSNRGVREQIVRQIREIRPAKILGINVSVLYPPETKGPLERMFCNVMEGILGRKFTTALTSLSDYDKAIALYTEGFWQTFNIEVCREDDAIGLLKEFCINPYNKAIRKIEVENEGKLRAHIQGLRKKRQERVEDIERRTEARAREVITGLVPRQEREEFVLFDFAYHKDYYDQVCGEGSVNRLATDLPEQEVVRRYYAGFISHHSHAQMMRWHQKFSGIEEVTKRLVLMEGEVTRLRALESERARAAEAVERPIERGVVIPEVARGYEAIYQRFLKGVLIYRPNGDGNDTGRINLPIAALGNPLEGVFDLSGCGDAGQHLSIATGYRKGKKAENANKVEIWLAPRFLIERNLAATSGHFQEIMGGWDGAVAPVGIFWTWGGWDNLGYYDYLTTNNMDALGSENLYEKLKKATHSTHHTHCTPQHLLITTTTFIQYSVARQAISCSFCELK